MSDDPIGDGGTSPSPQPWWKAALAQFLLPASISTLVAGVSISAQHLAAEQNAQTYNTSFEKLLEDSVVNNAGFYSGDTRQASTTLIALHDLALTDEQKATVLLIAARLVHANPDPSTAAAPARALAALLEEDKDNRTLRNLVRSHAYIALVTSGYATAYFDDTERLPHKDLMPTLNGDQPVGTDPEEVLLEKLSPTGNSIDDWIHLATFSTTYRHPLVPAPPQHFARPNGGQAIASKTAIEFVSDIAEVTRGDLSHACNVREQYAMELPPKPQPLPTPAARIPPADPACAPAPMGAMPPLIGGITWMQRRPTNLMLVAPRLLRDRPPVVFVNPDGTFMQGSLGQVVGVAPAGACVDVVDDVRPVLVFVESQYLRGKPQQHVTPEANHWAGLIHLWAHVIPSQGGCAFPTAQPSP